jgi:curved DNA-binding protein CbpA
METLKDLITHLGTDPYSILKTEPNTDLLTLRRNYRALAIQYHPDKNED